ncbi:Heat shock protein 15 [bacterium HR40]|nr:Heat shock protein 15 [bacterium HR40]
MTERVAIRIDRWLVHARFVRRRELVPGFLVERRVRLNGQPVTKSHQPVRPGDVLTLILGRRLVLVRVMALGDRRGPASEARRLYEMLEGSDPLSG